MPRRRQTPVESESVEVQELESREISATGDVDTSVPEIEIVEGPGAMAKAEELAFMEEPVEVMVMESTDPNAEQLVQLSVNGRNQFVPRGIPVKMRRKFVGVLAATKQTSYTQQKRIDPRNGNVSMTMDPHTALRYPFTVISDQNPRGGDWLKKVLREAA